MGKTVLIVLLGVILFFGVTNLIITKNMTSMTEKSVDIFAQTRARNIGNSAIWILKNDLWKNPSLRATSPLTMQLDGGTAVYRIIDTNYAGESLVKLDIRANFLNASKKIDTYVKMSYITPSFFRRAVLGHEEVTFNGNYLSAKDTSNPTLNADVHSNKEVILNGSNYLIEGFVTSAGNILLGGTNIKVLPNDNPLGLPAMQKYVAPVNIPDMVPSTYAAKATITYTDEHHFSGDIYLGTATTPKIIYVKGNKAFFDASGTTIYGYGVIIADYDIEVYGNIKINTPDPYFSQFGLFTGGKVLIQSAGLSVEATVYSQDESVINKENSKIIGSFTSKKKVTFNGISQTLYYKPPMESIISPFFQLEKRRPKLVHWYE